MGKNNQLSLVCVFFFQKQQHQRPDPVCSRSHRLQPAAIPARRAARGCRSHRLLHEAFSSFQLQAGPQTGAVQRPAHQGLRTCVGWPRSLKDQHKSPRHVFWLVLASACSLCVCVFCFHREPCRISHTVSEVTNCSWCLSSFPWPVILSPRQSLSTKGTVNPQLPPPNWKNSWSSWDFFRNCFELPDF